MLAKLLKRLLDSWAAGLGVMVVTFPPGEVEKLWCVHCGQRIVGVRNLAADGIFCPECRNRLCPTREHDVRVYVHCGG